MDLGQFKTSLSNFIKFLAYTVCVALSHYICDTGLLKKIETLCALLNAPPHYYHLTKIENPSGTTNHFFL